MRPESGFSALATSAFGKGFRAAAQNFPAILALQLAMAMIVAVYYLWPPGSALLSRYAAWQQSGGAWANGVAGSLAGGLLSEVSLVYVQDRGRWSAKHVENMLFKMVMFFFSGSLVYKFYQLQAFWWGNGIALDVLVPKVIVDQFGYTVVLAAPYYALLMRWQALGYSFARLWAEMDRYFLTERLLPMLGLNWMFWIPAISLVYAMPWPLQAPLAVFATAMWGLLVPAVSRQEDPPRAPETIPLAQIDT